MLFILCQLFYHSECMSLYLSNISHATVQFSFILKFILTPSFILLLLKISHKYILLHSLDFCGCPILQADRQTNVQSNVGFVGLFLQKSTSECTLVCLSACLIGKTGIPQNSTIHSVKTDQLISH